MSNRQAARLFVAVLGMVSLVGCVRAINYKKLDTVKSAAIIAFNGEVDIREERPEYQGSSISGGLSAMQGLSDVGSAETEARRVEEGQKTYDALVEKLSAGLGWKVISRETVTSNPEMKKIFGQKMSAVKVNKGFRFGVDQILWSEYGDLPVEQQQALKTALGVDVLLVVKVQVKQGRLYGYGVGQDGLFDVYPKAVLSLSAYDGGDEGVLWRENLVQGAETQGKMKRTMGVNDTTEEAKLVVESAQLAADALIAKYAKAKADSAATMETASAPAP